MERKGEWRKGEKGKNISSPLLALIPSPPLFSLTFGLVTYKIHA
jgi:hypothetical protein